MDVIYYSTRHLSPGLIGSNKPLGLGPNGLFSLHFAKCLEQWDSLTVEMRLVALLCAGKEIFSPTFKF